MLPFLALWAAIVVFVLSIDCAKVNTNFTDFSRYFCRADDPVYFFGINSALQFLGLPALPFPYLFVVIILSLQLLLISSILRVFPGALVMGQKNLAFLLFIGTFLIISPSYAYGLFNVSRQFLAFSLALPSSFLLSNNYLLVNSSASRRYRHIMLPFAIVAFVLHPSSLLLYIATFFDLRVAFATPLRLIKDLKLKISFWLAFPILLIIFFLARPLIAMSQYSYLILHDSAFQSLGNFIARVSYDLAIILFLFYATSRFSALNSSASKSSFPFFMISSDLMSNAFRGFAVNVSIFIVVLSSIVCVSLSELLGLRLLYYADWTLTLALAITIFSCLPFQRHIQPSFLIPSFLNPFRSLSRSPAAYFVIFAYYALSLNTFVLQRPNSLSLILSGFL